MSIQDRTFSAPKNFMHYKSNEEKVVPLESAMKNIFSLDRI
jgi:hypothetical protein